MFSNTRRCLIGLSLRIRGKYLVQPIHEDVLSPKLRSRANLGYSNATALKRFYCHDTVNTINEQNVTSTDLRERQQKLERQKLDEFLSNPENHKRFQILELEIDVMRHSAEKVPKELEPKDWLQLLNTMSKTRRKKYLAFLWTNEKSFENMKAKKELRKAEFLAKKEAGALVPEDTAEIKYGLKDNSLFLRIYETTMNRVYNGKLLQCMMYEPKIVFDCSYENDMQQREIHNCAKQMCLAFANNRNHPNPMYFYFCNFNKDGLLKQHLHQNIPTLLNDDFPVTVTSQSYLDIFPKNQLVYLTPHCKVNLQEYDPDSVYIIGAFVDKADSQPLSMAKAKREGIRMARFPIDSYLDWGASSSKCLTIDQTIMVMLDLRHTGDWKKALTNVPARKLKPHRQHMLLSKLHRSGVTDLTDVTDVTNAPETRKSKAPSLSFTFQNRKRN
ncbi:PREDICTED: mitochondrial ribonuclease P protein 1 homolog [Vollenhovia emeryi]|uniref:mitochondrial ribonuclease P protein 1 homolog n=1 Tax=Vollenhovia emeryi TaxID=411798 RepID=UPI0005F512EE|nr:PREDICTED: mitochondrial ribonuclease P protein 1 homolog [Vollenhovia emeryi]XP_011873388.1 PREDICTED: mitochondrial ribonuclease P protein 1 homolog [Vollenhovia emeryi]